MTASVLWVVDHIEEGVAAIEVDGARLLHFPLAQLPSGLREGDVLRVVVTRDGPRATLLIERDAAATASRRQPPAPPPPGAKRDPGGDIQL